MPKVHWSEFVNLRRFVSFCYFIILNVVNVG